jgi:membrane protein
VFLAVSYGFRVYVQNFGSYNQVYGSLGGVMVLMLWFWVSSVVLLSAAATNKVLEEVEQGLTPI